MLGLGIPKPTLLNIRGAGLLMNDYQQYAQQNGFILESAACIKAAIQDLGVREPSDYYDNIILRWRLMGMTQVNTTCLQNAVNRYNVQL